VKPTTLRSPLSKGMPFAQRQPYETELL
jgi:hypothetical protein